MSSIVRYKRNELPLLSDKRKAELKALADLPDDQIDLSDIPPLPEEFWANAEQGRFYKPTKTHASVRIDSDVLAWLKNQGKGYQTKLNAILRNAMLESKHHKTR
jgi:uncharacterized protein (DUF4415 family)